MTEKCLPEKRPMIILVGFHNFTIFSMPFIWIYVCIELVFEQKKYLKIEHVFFLTDTLTHLDSCT